jgi:hypothetical protein
VATPGVDRVKKAMCEYRPFSSANTVGWIVRMDGQIRDALGPNRAHDCMAANVDG